MKPYRSDTLDRVTSAYMAASPGDWELKTVHWGHCIWSGNVEIAGCKKIDDALFILTASEYIPTLLARIKELEKMLVEKNHE
jgi:hypothetical protein